jgi:hypothetical protein
MRVRKDNKGTYRTTAVAQFDAVAPDNDFTTKICSTLRASKILEGIIRPNPSVVGNSERSFGMS